MNDIDYLNRVLPFYPKAFIVERTRELIVEPKNNLYFRLEDIESVLNFDCKMLEWLSRGSCKGLSNYWQSYMLRGLNSYFRINWSSDDMKEIYTYLGNNCNREKCIAFIKSNFDMTILKSKIGR